MLNDVRSTRCFSLAMPFGVFVVRCSLSCGMRTESATARYLGGACARDVVVSNVLLLFLLLPQTMALCRVPLFWNRVV